jgi:hypothetical protein
MPIRSFVESGAFEPEVLAVMGDVFKSACEEQPLVAPEVIARKIVTAARFGERDPVRLREAALKQTE